MNKLNLLRLSSYLLFSFGLLTSACNNEESITLSESFKNTESIGKNTRVTLQDVQALTGALRSQTRSTNTEKYVCVTDTAIGDTLFYVVNYPEGGWTMYASDRRVPAVVAENEKGTFQLEEMEKATGEWLECMKEDMKAVRGAKDSELSFSPEEIEANRDYWQAICEPNEFVARHTEGTRGMNDFLFGHYELYETHTETVVYDFINHLTATRWHQHEPYNAFCPAVANGSSEKCPAGCVAIAGAQMLYFLHYKMDRPLYVPDSAYCIGYANGSIQAYVWEQYTHCWDVWSKMPHDGNSTDSVYYFDGTLIPEGKVAAPLVARVAKLANMQFDNDGSSADYKKLSNMVFPSYGYDCDREEFNTSKVYTSLLGGMPVVAHAKRNLTKGHSFIIDAYERKATKTTRVYRWVPDMPLNPGGGNGQLPITPTRPDSIVTSYSNFQLSQIKMNWGWQDTLKNETWYTPTGDWIANGHNYNRDRHIIHNFRKKQL